jgi:mannan endo-1,4-beta-mannosidase
MLLLLSNVPLIYCRLEAIDDFNQRITHILNGHKNALLGNTPWSELSAYIFGFEAQNEPMIFDQTFYKVRGNAFSGRCSTL